jgi:hypothetical protein
MDKIADSEDLGLESIDLEELSRVIGEVLGELDDLPGLVYDDGEDDDEDDEEYKSGTLGEEMKRYQREFRKHAEIIRKELQKKGYRIDTDGRGRDPLRPLQYSAGKKSDSDPEAYRSPSERGHKFGCGCPGCTSFRERIFGEGMGDISLLDIRAGLARPVSSKYESPRKKEPSEYPCGGKLRGFFHGKEGFLKYTFMEMGKSRRLMNYMAL